MPPQHGAVRACCRRLSREQPRRPPLLWHTLCHGCAVLTQGKPQSGWRWPGPRCPAWPPRLLLALAALLAALMRAPLALAAPRAAARCSGLPQPLQPLAPGVWWVPGDTGDSQAGNRGQVSAVVLVRQGHGAAARLWALGSGPARPGAGPGLPGAPAAGGRSGRPGHRRHQPLGPARTGAGRGRPAICPPAGGRAAAGGLAPLGACGRGRGHGPPVPTLRGPAAPAPGPGRRGSGRRPHPPARPAAAG